jgi:mono/diheme cytochrome c family protein
LARSRRLEGALLAASLLALPALPGAGAPPELAFARHSEPVARLDRAALRRVAGERRVRVFEPYEGREASFAALPFEAVLDAVYGAAWRAEEELLFTCRDGYQPTLPVARVLAHRAWLAFDRPGEGGFALRKLESGEERRIELGPFYLVWENLEDEALRLEGDYGWPYQLVGVDLIRPRERFPRMAPPPDAAPEVLAGFAEFRIHCSRCHALNGEGGSIGADLNRPRSPVEYRDREWLRRWIDDPSRILPTARMPKLNPALTDRDRVIDAILAYLEAMSRARRAEGADG